MKLLRTATYEAKTRRGVPARAEDMTDMLRYDNAFVRDVDPDKSWTCPYCNGKKRSTKGIDCTACNATGVIPEAKPDSPGLLVLFCQFKGGNNIKPTFDRWFSMGFILTEVEDPEYQLSPERACSEASKWKTQQHPQVSPYGPTNYSAFEAVPLKAFLDAKKIDEVRRPLDAAERKRHAR